jgi:hypothetical protein
MIKSIIKVEFSDLNEKMIPLVAHTNIQLKIYRKAPNKGLMSILSMLGDADELMRLQEMDY